ncbi:MAG: sirohydrochlorin chelatase [Labedaea sp.]
MAPPLVAVAHGSRNPRSAATVTRLLQVARAMRPWLDIRVAFLDLSAPRLGDVLGALDGEAGEAVKEAVVVPLLLGEAYHARVDVPAMVHEATARHPRLSVSVAGVLGPDPRLESLALDRLLATGARLDDPELGVVLAAAGSTHPPANAAVSAVARRWAARYGWAGATAAFASATEPDVPGAVRLLRARGARRIAVASWFLAPGRLPDRVAIEARAAEPGALVALPLGAARGLAGVLLDRYDEELTEAAGGRYA